MMSATKDRSKDLPMRVACARHDRASPLMSGGISARQSADQLAASRRRYAGGLGLVQESWTIPKSSGASQRTATTGTSLGGRLLRRRLDHLLVRSYSHKATYRHA